MSAAAHRELPAWPFTSSSEHQPWLTLIGVGEDGAAGLNAASQAALAAAEVIFASPRQAVLLGLQRDARLRLWPVPLALGELMAHRGRQVVALASGDPFHFGLGAVLARSLPAHEWRCAGASASAFSMMAARLGWALQEVVCLGLHAAPLQGLRPYCSDGQRLLILLRDAPAIEHLADYLNANGFGASTIYLFAALGGKRELSAQYPDAYFVQYASQIQNNADARFQHYLPICAAVQIKAEADNPPPHFPLTPGRALHWFEHDGQISKPSVRAITLAALAPARGQRLWDLGAGSGAVALEWCAASGGAALCVEKDPERAQRIERNAAHWGLKKSQLQVVQHDWGQLFLNMPDHSHPHSNQHVHTENPHNAFCGRLAQKPFRGEVRSQAQPYFQPDAIFIGGGLSQSHWGQLFPHIPKKCRVVVNAVTLENQALIMALQKKWGGQLLKFDYAHPAPLGDFQFWKAAATLMQWVWEK